MQWGDVPGDAPGDELGITPGKALGDEPGDALREVEDHNMIIS